jgi:hypothetical protein
VGAQVPRRDRTCAWWLVMMMMMMMMMMAVDVVRVAA